MINKTQTNDAIQSNEVEIVFSEHRKQRKQEQFNRQKPRLFFFSFLILIISLFGFYLLSDYSKVQRIIIEGNYLLSNEEIQELTDISYDDIWLFVNQSKINEIGQKNPLIDEITIEKKPQCLLVLHVKEKKVIGYRYLDYPELITDEGECIPLEDNQNHLLSRLPLIVGFNQMLTEEELNSDEPTLIKKLAKAMSAVDSIRIEMIAEIHQYEYSYDQNGILCIMQDGNEIYGSMYSMEMLNSYNQVASALVKKKNCIYIDEMSGNPYVSLCPEEQEALEAAQENEENDKKADE